MLLFQTKNEFATNNFKVLKFWFFLLQKNSNQELYDGRGTLTTEPFSPSSSYCRNADSGYLYSLCNWKILSYPLNSFQIYKKYSLTNSNINFQNFTIQNFKKKDQYIKIWKIWKNLNKIQKSKKSKSSNKKWKVVFSCFFVILHNLEIFQKIIF